MPNRTLTFAGNGTLKTWFEPSGLEGQLAQALTNAGYGVTNLTLTNIPTIAGAVASTILTAGIPVTWNYKISVTVNSPDDENPERVRQAFTDYFNNYFDNVSLSLSYDSGAGVLGNIGNLFSQATNPNGSAKSNMDSLMPYILVGGVLLLGFAFIGGRGLTGGYRRR